MTGRTRLTTTVGAPVVSNGTSRTAGPCGPLLLEDCQLIEKLAHQNRQRIPERLVHATGWGAQGTFTVTHDITRCTRARLFAEVGKQTAVLARWSTVDGGRVTCGGGRPQVPHPTRQATAHRLRGF